MTHNFNNVFKHCENFFFLAYLFNGAVFIYIICFTEKNNQQNSINEGLISSFVWHWV